MGDNKLLLRKQEELISEINDAISALKTLIELSPDSKSEELNEWQDAIVKLEDELLEIDDDRWYLVAEEDNSKIKIDFWEKYETNEVEEINENGYRRTSQRNYGKENESIILFTGWRGSVGFCRTIRSIFLCRL